MNAKRIAIFCAPPLLFAAALFAASWYFSSPRTARRAKVRATKAVALSTPESPSNDSPAPSAARARGLPVPKALVAERRPALGAAEPAVPRAATAPSEQAAALPSPADQAKAREEGFIRSRFEPLVANRADANLNFVVCETAPPDPQAPSGELAAAGSDPTRPHCRARMQARDPAALKTLLQGASTLYAGHLAIEVAERFDAFTGRWFEADIHVGTDDAHPLPEL